MKRGWCPDVLHPMPTGDGLLVRLHPPLGRLTAGQLQAIATTARTCGNGLLDISSRGNLQIRGVFAHSHPALVEQLAAAGLAGPEQRRTIVSPLAGLDPTDHVDAAALARTGRSRAADRRGASRQARNRGRRRRAVPAGRARCRDLRGRRLQQQHRRRSRRSDGPRWCGTTSPSALPSALVAMLTDFADAVGSWEVVGDAGRPGRSARETCRCCAARAADRADAAPNGAACRPAADAGRPGKRRSRAAVWPVRR